MDLFFGLVVEFECVMIWIFFYYGYILIYIVCIFVIYCFIEYVKFYSFIE